MSQKKCVECKVRKETEDFYKTNPTTCKKCAVALAATRRKVGLVSMHDKIDKILEKQDKILKSHQSYVKQLKKQVAIVQDLAEHVENMDKEISKLTKKVRKLTMDQ